MSQRHYYEEEKINKQKLLKQMPPDMKHPILANTNVKLYWWPLTFHKVVWQQIWGEVIIVIQTSFADPLSI